ncbi:carbonic anhydrase family protein [Ideonella sp. 4Y16]|uniref:carbonic anhydrase n=1 Tax=Ideonella alba TaxID=2824118 RepID=A0A940YG32_9BURK|nr:carbonic anhydrase family protein [Ideonella alba]MBQ0931842.1 carbonic anhydrase family protein [Ideonella alba]MBQ0941714.1 carbonic anhydrase family protein [Ideonella alba]
MPHAPRRLRLSLALATLALASVPVWAGGEHGHAEPAAKPAAKPATEPKAANGKESISMDELRERLAARLGATKSPEAKSNYVMRVTNKAEAPSEPVRRAAPKAAEPAADSHGGHGGAGAAAQLLPHAAHDPHWAYEGANGPQSWGSLKPEFATCASGQRQSPIDIRDGIPLELQPIEFAYIPTGFSVIDNGHTVQVNVPQGNAISVQGKRFELLQFHFHRPSEERINGRQFDMVVHLVHKDLDGRLAVVAVMLDRGSAHPLIQAVWNALPLEKGVAEPAPTTLDLNQLLPKDRRYYTYMGSLTTPPCSEGVLWMVMKEPVQLSPQQIGIFARLYPMNARPIQKTAGRMIKEGQ